MLRFNPLNGGALDCIVTRVNGRIKIIPYNEIIYVKAQKNYAEIVTSKSKVVICAPLTKVEEKLPKHIFYRIHRSYIVSIEMIKEFDHHTVFIDNERLPLSSQHYETLWKIFRKACVYEEKIKSNGLNGETNWKKKCKDDK